MKAPKVSPTGKSAAKKRPSNAPIAVIASTRLALLRCDTDGLCSMHKLLVQSTDPALQRLRAALRSRDRVPGGLRERIGVADATARSMQLAILGSDHTTLLRLRKAVAASDETTLAQARAALGSDHTTLLPVLAALGSDHTTL